MVEDSKWMNNVGEVFLSEESECFWMLPVECFFNTKLRITSPWFSYKGERWCLVKSVETTQDIANYYGSSQTVLCASLYLWKKVRHGPPSDEYTFKVHLKSIRDKSTLVSHSVNMNSDFGFECLKFGIIDPNARMRSRLKSHDVSCCGLMKLFFEIRKHLKIIDFFPSTITEMEDNSESDEESEKSEEPEPKGIDRLVQNLKNLLLDEQTSDVLLKIEDREFKVHKAILKVRSPVFASMFQPKTKESITGVVDIPDISASAFEVFLSYMYTGSTDAISSSNVADLYYAADKYEMNDLKAECVEFMENNLSVDNFCDVMTLSLQHSESSLQKTAKQFFCKNVKVIIKTVQWQKYLKDYPTQANELYIKAINA